MSSADPRTAVVEKVFPHSPEKVWRALTETGLIQQWLLDNNFEPIVGHRCTFRFKPMPQWDGIVESEVLAIEPYRKLSYTWQSLGLKTVVVWTLTEVDGGTRLRVEQSGFPPDLKAALHGATSGWQSFLDKMEPLLAGLE